MFAIAVIQAEHRNLGMTMLCLQKIFDDMEHHNRKVDHRLLDSIMKYVESFLYRFHHPKEDDYLFPAILRHHPAAESLIDKLQSDHEAGAGACASLRQALSDFASEAMHTRQQRSVPESAVADRYGLGYTQRIFIRYLWPPMR